MEVALHPSVLDLFISHASPADINRAAFMIDPEMDINILLCFAVYYRHKQYIITQRFWMGSEYTPLITAIYDKAYDLIPLLSKQWLEKSCATFDECYGKIQNDKLKTDKLVTVWDAVFEMDDPEALRRLDGVELCGWETLVRLAKLHGAHYCLEALASAIQYDSEGPLNAGQKSSIPSSESDSKPEGLNFVATIWSIACRTSSGQGNITPLIREEVLHMSSKWASVRNSGQNRFLTRSDEDLIDKLLTGEPEELVRHCQQEYKDSTKPLTTLDNGSNEIFCLDLHAKIILEVWHESLSNPAGQMDAKSNMYLVQNTLTNRILAPMWKFKILKDQCPTQYVRSMFLINTMTKMLMQCEDDFKRIYFDTRWLRVVCDDPCSISLPLYNQFCKHLMILIAHRHDLITFDLSDEHKVTHYLEFPKEAKYVCCVSQVIVSMLPHDKYEAYRLDIKRRQQLIEEELNKDAIDENVMKELHRNIENTHDVNTPRPLEQLCRLKLYEMIPGNMLPRIVYKLDINYSLKYFLTLGVNPNTLKMIN